MPPEILAATHAFPSFTPIFEVSPLSEDQVRKAQATTWRPGCPVALESLRMVRIAHWDFTAVPTIGTLIVHERVCDDVVAVFTALFDHGFLIESVRPIEDFGGDDDLSMANNNTSGFNCRPMTGGSGQLSRHSWGSAVDINPLCNPFVQGEMVAPPRGRLYLDRTRAYPGAILDGSVAVELFTKRGWVWGGAQTTFKDFQHFEVDVSRR
jgi:hypothetical protein